MALHRRLCLVFFLLIVPSMAQAQFLSEQEYHKNITVRQKLPFSESGRLELAGFGASSINPIMYYNWGAAGQISWHFSETFFAGLDYSQWFSNETALKTEVKNDFNLPTDRAELAYQGLVRAGWVPVVGKASVFGGGPVYFDFHVVGGVGVTGTRLSKRAPTVNVGVGSRLFLSSALALEVELSDSAYLEEYLDGTGLVHNVRVLAGLGLFFPFSVENRVAK